MIQFHIYSFSDTLQTPKNRDSHTVEYIRFRRGPASADSKLSEPGSAGTPPGRELPRSPRRNATARRPRGGRVSIHPTFLKMLGKIIPNSPNNEISSNLRKPINPNIRYLHPKKPPISPSKTLTFHPARLCGNRLCCASRNRQIRPRNPRPTFGFTSPSITDKQATR